MLIFFKRLFQETHTDCQDGNFFFTETRGNEGRERSVFPEAKGKQCSQEVKESVVLAAPGKS